MFPAIIGEVENEIDSSASTWPLDDLVCDLHRPRDESEMTQAESSLLGDLEDDFPVPQVGFCCITVYILYCKAFVGQVLNICWT